MLKVSLGGAQPVPALVRLHVERWIPEATCRFSVALRHIGELEADGCLSFRGLFSRATLWFVCGSRRHRSVSGSPPVPLRIAHRACGMPPRVIAPSSACRLTAQPQGGGAQRRGSCVVERPRQSVGNARKRQPGAQELAEHLATHIRYRSWCPHCLWGLGRNTRRRQRELSDREVPLTSADY